MLRLCKRLGTLLLIFLLCVGCNRLRRNAEVKYYRDLVSELDNLPKSVKEKCQYAGFDAPPPAFIANESVKTAELRNRIVVHYNPDLIELIQHEAMHYQNRMKQIGDGRYQNVSWECLDEISAYAMHEYILWKDQARYYRRLIRQGKGGGLNP